MFRLVLALSVLFVTVSCGQSPEADQADSAVTSDDTSSAEIPKAKNSASEQSARVAPVETPPTDGSASERATRLATGEIAPSFRLQDQDGVTRSLDEFLTKGKVALVFYRSADW